MSVGKFSPLLLLRHVGLGSGRAQGFTRLWLLPRLGVPGGSGLRVYPWRNFSLLLITFNSTTGTPLKGSYTFTHWGLSSETSLPSHPHFHHSPNLVSNARHQLGRSSIKTISVILYKQDLSKRYLD
jgi:hypothetical protein